MHAGMRATYWLFLVTGLDVLLVMPINIIFLRASLQELAELLCRRAQWVRHTEDTVAGGGEHSVVDEGVALDRQLFGASKVQTAMVALFGLTEYPLMAQEAELGKAGVCFLEAVVDVFPVVRDLQICVLVPAWVVNWGRFRRRVEFAHQQLVRLQARPKRDFCICPAQSDYIAEGVETSRAV